MHKIASEYEYSLLLSDGTEQVVRRTAPHRIRVFDRTRDPPTIRSATASNTQKMDDCHAAVCNLAIRSIIRDVSALNVERQAATTALSTPRLRLSTTPSGSSSDSNEAAGYASMIHSIATGTISACSKYLPNSSHQYRGHRNATAKAYDAQLTGRLSSLCPGCAGRARTVKTTVVASLQALVGAARASILGDTVAAILVGAPHCLPCTPDLKAATNSADTGPFAATAIASSSSSSTASNPYASVAQERQPGLGTGTICKSAAGILKGTSSAAHRIGSKRSSRTARSPLKGSLSKRQRIEGAETKPAAGAAGAHEEDSEMVRAAAASGRSKSTRPGMCPGWACGGIPILTLRELDERLVYSFSGLQSIINLPVCKEEQPTGGLVLPGTAAAPAERGASGGNRDVTPSTYAGTGAGAYTGAIAGAGAGTEAGTGAGAGVGAASSSRSAKNGVAAFTTVPSALVQKAMAMVPSVPAPLSTGINGGRSSRESGAATSSSSSSELSIAPDGQPKEAAAVSAISAGAGSTTGSLPTVVGPTLGTTAAAGHRVTKGGVYTVFLGTAMEADQLVRDVIKKYFG